MKLIKHYVTIYKVNRAYGGPEEGGWWYDYGIPEEERHTYGFASEEQADQFAIRLNQLLDYLINQYLRPISSISSQDNYRAIASSTPPQPWPKEIPKFE